MPGESEHSPGTLDPLVALVCGFEKSGTTLINEILRRHPRLDSGHEVGVLLGDSPRDFRTTQPYFGFFCETWKLSRAEAEQVCDTDDWSTFYRRARDASPVIVDKTVSVFDKTPIYMLHLSEVLRKAPLPCVVSVRDPRALMHSWANWSGHAHDPGAWLEEHFERNCERFLSYARGYSEANRSFPDLVMVSQFERLSTNPEVEFEEIFRFLGLTFRREYLSFRSEHFVYGNAVSSDYVFAYRQSLSNELCDRILDATRDFEEWHYHDQPPHQHYEPAEQSCRPLRRPNHHHSLRPRNLNYLRVVEIPASVRLVRSNAAADNSSTQQAPSPTVPPRWSPMLGPG